MTTDTPWPSSLAVRIPRCLTPAAAALLLATLCLLAGSVRADELRELEFEELDASGIMTDDPEAAVLVVETTVMPLSFFSRGGIRRVREPETGIYHVIVDAGVHHLEISADGYLRLRMPRRNYEPRSGRKIRVRAKPHFGAAAAFDAARPELRLDFTPPSGAEVYVQLDDNPPQKLDFSRGYITLRPVPGTHTVRVYAGGRVWEQTLELEVGEQYREAIALAGGTASDFAAAHPGNLFIESTPPGATVYLNQVEQQGVTPLSLTDLQPGSYQVEVVLAQHLPAAQQGEVRELDYTTIRVELTPNYGRVEVGSQPGGALVYLNDEQRGTTPLSTRLEAGIYPLRLVQEMYHDAHDTLRIEPGTQFSHIYELQPRFGTVDVTSEPAGARVRVDEASWGVTPLRREQVLSGRHVIQVELQGYPPQQREVQVRDAQTHTAHFDLSRSVGYLTATSEPPGATVVVRESGRELGRTPLTRVPLQPGSYTLLFRLPDHDEAVHLVPVAPGDTPRVQVPLTRHVGHVRVESTPSGARILLDGEPRGHTPQVLRDVPTGRHLLRLEREGFDPDTQPVHVQHGVVLDYRVTLGSAGTEAWRARRARARKLAVVPGLGQLVSPGQRWRGLLYAGGIGAAGYLAHDAHTRYDRAQTEYDAALQAYRATYFQAAMDQQHGAALRARDDMGSARRHFTMTLAAAVAVYGVQWLDALLFGGGRLEAFTRPTALAAPDPALPATTTAAGLELAWRFRSP